MHGSLYLLISCPCLAPLPSLFLLLVTGLFPMSLSPDFPGDPVVKTPHFQWKGHGFNLWSGKFYVLSNAVKKRKQKFYVCESFFLIIFTSLFYFLDFTYKRYVHLWLIHDDVWQKTTKFCKAIILQLKNKYLFLKRDI